MTRTWLPKGSRSAQSIPPDAAEVPAEVVDLAVHWTGAFIVYLADATTT